MPDGQPSILVMEKAVRVLDCFSPEHTRLSLSDIRRLTGMPNSTVARLVRTLVESELLQRTGDDYCVGLRVLSWSSAAAAGSDLLVAADPVAAHLRDVTGETAGVYIRRGTTRVAVIVKLSPRSIIFRCDVGQLAPVSQGAGGKVFMAHDERVLNAVLVETAEQATGEPRAALEGQLEFVRANGWLLTEEEREAGLSSMAAPVFDASGAVVAALAVGGPSFRLDRAMAEEFGPMVAESAKALSRRLGYPGQADRSAEETA
ncbi:IclR family transcriptional regulator [Amycolatopsis solani]|uniref:IclR family transcriptional regulator n=1 Tax=Amycolatopsis solani TaxID=3028615 RepID=UPI0025B0B991|nr:IclR family transcriptional regulator [Amycolatopsis sp. MEP2-6]